jgi:hypothetical protein
MHYHNMMCACEMWGMMKGAIGSLVITVLFASIMAWGRNFTNVYKNMLKKDSQ